AEPSKLVGEDHAQEVEKHGGRGDRDHDEELPGDDLPARDRLDRQGLERSALLLSGDEIDRRERAARKDEEDEKSRKNPREIRGAPLRFGRDVVTVDGMKALLVERDVAHAKRGRPKVALPAIENALEPVASLDGCLRRAPPEDLEMRLLVARRARIDDDEKIEVAFSHRFGTRRVVDDLDERRLGEDGREARDRPGDSHANRARLERFAMRISRAVDRPDAERAEEER